MRWKSKTADFEGLGWCCGRPAWAQREATRPELESLVAAPSRAFHTRLARVHLDRHLYLDALMHDALGVLLWKHLIAGSSRMITGPSAGGPASG